MGLRKQAEGGLLLVVVVVVYTQVHGEDGCRCGGHLQGQCCCAHVHCKMRQTSQAKDYCHISFSEKIKSYLHVISAVHQLTANVKFRIRKRIRFSRPINIS